MKEKENIAKGSSARSGNEKVMVEVDELTLKEILEKNDLKIGKEVRLIKGLEIMPGDIVSKIYDR